MTAQTAVSRGRHVGPSDGVPRRVRSLHAGVLPQDLGKIQLKLLAGPREAPRRHSQRSRLRVADDDHLPLHAAVKREAHCRRSLSLKWCRPAVNARSAQRASQSPYAVTRVFPSMLEALQ